MADAEPITLAIKGSVATIVLKKPAITMPMAQALMKYMAALNGPEHEAVRVIVLTGSSKYFCTGMDLNVAPSKNSKAAAGGVGDTSANKSFKPYALFEAIWGSPKPVVAVMNGPAMGGGVGLLYACDIRIASDQSFIKFPEAALGIFPALISGYISPQLGPYLTQSLMMTGEPMSAAELKSFGQVSAVCPPDRLQATTEQIVAKLLTAPKGSHAGVKRIIRTVSYQGEYHQEAMDSLMSEFGGMMRSPEARHGMKTFRAERKAPDWDEYYRQQATKSKL